MALLDVWIEARARLAAAGPGLGVRFSWPNEDFETDGDIFVAVEIEGGSSSPMEVGRGGPWDEDGAILCFVTVPQGIGVDDGLRVRDLIETVLLSPPPTQAEFVRVDKDMGGRSEDGGWFSLPLRAAFRIEHRPVSA